MNYRKLIVAIIIACAAISVIGMAVGKWRTYQHIRSNPHHVTITDINAHKDDLDRKVVGDIESGIYRRLRTSLQHPDPYYEASIRKDGYAKTYNTYEGDYPPSKVPTVTFLVDIPKAARTYRVRFSGGPTYPYAILYVLCPQANENIYDSFACTDGAR